MTHKAVLCVTRILQNRNLLECSGVTKFSEDDEGYVTWIRFPAYAGDGRIYPELKIRIYEKPDQKHGVIFRFEFHEGKRPYFTVEEYLRNGTEVVSFLKKDERLKEPKMNEILESIHNRIQQSIDSVPKLGRYLAGAD